MRGLIYNGALVEADVEVRDGREYGLWWEPGDPGTEAKPNAGQLFVWHHKGGPGSARTTFRVLEKRGLAVNMSQDADGTLWQHADLSTWCYHAGKANAYGGGIELTNPGLAKYVRRFREIFRRRGYRRTIYEDEVHGRKLKFFRFLPVQMASALKLYDALERVVGIPPEWPFDEVDGRVVRTTIPDLHAFRGHICHFHVSRNKVGAVPHLADELAARACLAY